MAFHLHTYLDAIRLDLEEVENNHHHNSIIMIVKCERRNYQIDKNGHSTRIAFERVFAKDGFESLPSWWCSSQHSLMIRIFITHGLTIMYVRSAAFIVMWESEEGVPTRLLNILLLDVKALCVTKPLTRLVMMRAQSAVIEKVDLIMVTMIAV